MLYRRLNINQEVFILKIPAPRNVRPYNQDQMQLFPHYTKPEEVEEFVARTGVDSLAISIGTSHGA